MNIVILGGDYMNSDKELNWDELQHSYQPSDFSFFTTDEIDPYESIIGQEEALQSIQRALQIEAKGFNIYISGVDNEEKEKAVKAEVEKIAAQKDRPLAIGYVYNFTEPEIPCLIELEAKRARQLKEDIQEIKAFISNELPKRLKGADIEKKKDILIDSLDKYKEEQMMILEELADSYNLILKSTDEGMYFIPKDEIGKPISKTEYSNLSIQEKNDIQSKLEEVYKVAEVINEKIIDEEEKIKEVLKDVNQEVVLQEIGRMIKYLEEEYGSNPKLLNYFNGIAEDLLKNLDLISGVEGKDKENLKEFFLWGAGNDVEKLVKKYDFNLIVSWEDIKGAPVIDDDDMPQLTMTGKLLFDIEHNGAHSDFSQIKPGLLHYAKGGYLIVHMQKLVENPSMWMSLKRALKTQIISIDGNEELSLALTTPIKPEICMLDNKVVLLGTTELYQLLYEGDEDFRKLFKTHVYLETEVTSDRETIKKIAGVISRVCKREYLPTVTIDGVLRLIQEGNRKLESSSKLSSDMESLVDTLREAALFAKETIDARAIEMALKNKKSYSLKLQQRIDEQFKDKSYLLATEGQRIGQVNGLAIYQILNDHFGKPIKITVTTYKGKQGIVDIEKQAELSGAIHTKGIHIITGFLGNEFAQEYPLSLNCNICFEQSYSTIDGDSASSAELYGILSSLASLPVKQHLATTGSTNQFGEIQPIGGVNEKIEGFFQICQQRGLKGNEGVIIPEQNVKDLMLKEELVDAVRKGLFHIYPICHIWEGMELMTGKTKEEIVDLVKKKLKRYRE